MEWLIAVVLAFSAAAAGQTPEESLREWLTWWAANDAVLAEDGPEGVAIEWILVRSTDLPLSHIQAKWEEVEPYPDHRDRSLWKYLGDLARNPERTDGEIHFADSGAWLLVERLEAYTFRSGGADDLRWMLYQEPTDGQLTIIQSSVPFPPGYNVGQIFDQAVAHASLLLCSGMGAIANEPFVLESLQVNGERWKAEFRGEGTDRVVQVFGGRWPTGNHAIVERVEIPSAAAQDAPKTTVLFAEHRWCEPLGRPLPHEVTRHRPDHVSESYQVISIRPRLREDVLERAAVPNPQDARVVDFREPDSPAWAGYTGESAVVWKRDDGEDAYELSKAIRSHRPPAGGADSPSRDGISMTRGASIALSLLTVTAIIAASAYARIRRQA